MESDAEMVFAPPIDRRLDALGDLRVVPDELLSTIFESLSPPDIDRLACVSGMASCLGALTFAENQCALMGACIELDADRWFECLMEICPFHNVPLPSEDEKLPVGTGSNPEV